MTDREIVKIVKGYLTTCIPEFSQANILDSSVIRLRQAVTHFFPGSYQYMLSANTSIDNVFMSGDWIVNRHGSWSQEKAYVTGLEAANLVISRLKSGQQAEIIPVKPDEPHIQGLREINQTVRSIAQNLLSEFWLP